MCACARVRVYVFLCIQINPMLGVVIDIILRVYPVVFTAQKGRQFVCKPGSTRVIDHLARQAAVQGRGGGLALKNEKE